VVLLLPSALVLAAEQSFVRRRSILLTTGANGFDRAGSTFGCEPWILVGHVKNGKNCSCE